MFFYEKVNLHREEYIKQLDIKDTENIDFRDTRYLLEFFSKVLERILSSEGKKFLLEVIHFEESCIAKTNKITKDMLTKKIPESLELSSFVKNVKTIFCDEDTNEDIINI